MNKTESNREFTHKKKIILFIFAYKCAICQHQNNRNHVHHADCNHYNNSVYNLVPLCNDCHKRVHRLKIAFSVILSGTQKNNLELLEILWTASNRK